MSLATLFYELFPQEFRLHFDLPLCSEFVPPEVLPQMFVGLYISSCHSLGHSINEHFNKKLYKSLKTNPKLIDFTEFSLDKKMASALFLSLELTQNIKAVKVSESKHYQLFPSLIKLVKANRDLEEITFVDVEKVQGFKQFLEAIVGSSIISLNFHRFAFTEEMFGYLLYSNQSNMIQNITFNECGLVENRITLFMKLFDRFEQLTSLSISHDFNCITPSSLFSMKDFIVSTELTHLQLSNCNINLCDFFTIISGQSTSLQDIDLSLNVFTWKKDVEFELPATIEKINLSQVGWDVDALLYLLTSVDFKRSALVELSNMTVLDNKYERLFNLLEASSPSESPPQSIVWSNNRLDARFAMFLSRIHGLKLLDLSYPKYDDDKMVSILNSLVVLFQNTTISNFVLTGSKKRPNGPLICELLPVIQLKEYVLSIDVSSNNIGNQGIEVLSRFIENSPQLKEIKFDGQQPTQTQPYMNLMKSLKKHPKILDVPQPVSDFQALVNLFPQQKESLKSAWNDVVIHLNSNRDDLDETLDNVAITSFVEPSPNINDVNSTPVEEELQASWSVTLNLPVTIGDKEWDAMCKKYDIVAMTSIKAE